MITKSMKSKRKRRPNGSVSVWEKRGRYVLIWTCPIEKKRKYFYTRLPTGPANKKLAEQKAKLIELEIKSGKYTGSLDHLKPNYTRLQDTPFIDRLYEFVEYKSNSISDVTLAKYQSCTRALAYHLGGLPVEQVTDGIIWTWVNCLRQEGLANAQIKRKLGIPASCWDWAVERKKIPSSPNPWRLIMREIRSSTNQPPNPFTQEEKQKILELFYADQNFHHYAFLVQLTLNYGLRPGEVFGLQWKCLSEDKSELWIGQILSRGKLKPPKANKTRTIMLDYVDKAEFYQIAPSLIFTPDAGEKFIFLTKKGCPIDDHNFSRRIWTPALKKAGVLHRPFKNCRHTFVSHALDQGWTPWEIMGVTGHSQNVLFANYAGKIRKNEQKTKRSVRTNFQRRV